MAAVPPVLKTVYVCDDVLADPVSRKVSVLNAFLTVRPAAFPHELAKLCVLLGLRGGRGSALLRVDVVGGPTNSLIHRTPDREVRFLDPLMTVYGLFRLERIRFPGPGRYTVEVYCDSDFLDDEAITVLSVPEG